MTNRLPCRASGPRWVCTLLVSLGFLTGTALALITRNGREPMTGMWPPGIAGLVNHPSRFGGEIGPLAPAARFFFSGDTAVFNAMLAQYAKVTHQELVLYVQPGPPPQMEGDSNSRDFDLLINVSGEGFMILYSGGRVALEDVRLPDGVFAELYPLVDVPLDPSAKDAHDREVQRVRRILSQWARGGEVDCNVAPEPPRTQP